MPEVTVDQILVSPAMHQRIVVLNAKEADRCLPIMIGSAEADSTALKLEGKELPAPWQVLKDADIEIEGAPGVIKTSS